MAPPKQSWYAWLHRQLNEINISMSEFKQNPRTAYLKSKGIRKWMHKSFQYEFRDKKTIKWWNTNLNLHDIFTNDEWHMEGNKSFYY